MMTDLTNEAAILQTHYLAVMCVQHIVFLVQMQAFAVHQGAFSHDRHASTAIHVSIICYNFALHLTRNSTETGHLARGLILGELT